MKHLREQLRDRLHAQIENERWTLLLSQRKLIAEYERVAKQLLLSDAQIQRLLGPPPGTEICPECYYRTGSSVGLTLENEGNRAGDRVMVSPRRDLVLIPD